MGAPSIQSISQAEISQWLEDAYAMGNVAGVHIAAATELVLAGDLEGGIEELAKAKGHPEADRLLTAWEALRLNRQGLVVLSVAQEISQALGGAGNFEKLEQAIAAGLSFSQAYSTLSTEERNHLAKSLGGNGFVAKLREISSSSNLEILSQQLLALASSYSLGEGHEAGALVIYQALGSGLMGLAKGKVVNDATVALSVMQGEGKYKIAEVVKAASGLQQRLGDPNLIAMLVSGSLISRFVKVWMTGKGIGIVEGASQARAWEFLSATTATAAEVTYVTGWMELSQHGEINWDSYWKTWAHNAIIFGGVRAGVGMGLAGREAIHGINAAGLATRHFEYLKVTEGIARHAVPVASLTVLDKAVDPNGRSWFSTAVHATATTAELNAAGYLGRAAVPTVHRFETRQVFKERLYRNIAQDSRLTRIYQHAGRKLPDFLGNLPKGLATGPSLAWATAGGRSPLQNWMMSEQEPEAKGGGPSTRDGWVRAPRDPRETRVRGILDGINRSEAAATATVREGLTALREEGLLADALLQIEAGARKGIFGPRDYDTALFALSLMEREFVEYYREPRQVSFGEKLDLIRHTLDDREIDVAVFMRGIVLDLETIDHFYKIAQIADFMVHHREILRPFERGKLPTTLTDLLLKQPGRLADQGSCHPTAVLAAHLGHRVGVEFQVLSPEQHVALFTPQGGGLYFEPQSGDLLPPAYYESKKQVLNADQQPQPVEALLSAPLLKFAKGPEHRDKILFLLKAIGLETITVQLNKALFLAANGSEKEAIVQLQAFVGQHPHHVFARVVLAMLLIKEIGYASSKAEATQYLEAAVKILTVRAGGEGRDYQGSHLWVDDHIAQAAFANLGNMHLAETNYDDAVRVLELGRKLFPKDQTIQALLVRAYSLQFDDIRQQISLHDVDTDATIRAKALQRARENLLKAMQLIPNHAIFYGNLGNLSLAQGYFDEAIAYYRHALSLDPTNSWPFLLDQIGKLETRGYYNVACTVAEAFVEDLASHAPQLFGKIAEWKAILERGTYDPVEPRSLDPVALDHLAHDFAENRPHAWSDLLALMATGRIAEAYLVAEELTYPNGHPPVSALLPFVHGLEAYFEGFRQDPSRFPTFLDAARELDEQAAGEGISLNHDGSDYDLLYRLGQLRAYFASPASVLTPFRSRGEYPTELSALLRGELGAYPYPEPAYALNVLVAHLGHQIGIPFRAVPIDRSYVLWAPLGEGAFFDPFRGKLYHPRPYVGAGRVSASHLTQPPGLEHLLAVPLAQWAGRGSVDEGLVRVKRLGAPFPADRNILLRSAEKHYRLGQVADAEKILRDMLAQDPRQLDAFELLLEILVNERRFAEVAALIPESVQEGLLTYRDALGVDGLMGYPRQAMAKLNYSVGVYFLYQPDEAKAIRHLEMALRLVPDFHEARSGLLRVYIRQFNDYYDRKSYGMAAEVGQKYLELLPPGHDTHSTMVWNVGKAHLKDKLPNQAVDFWLGHIAEAGHLALVLSEYMVKKARKEGPAAYEPFAPLFEKRPSLRQEVRQMEAYQGYEPK